jgi:hypothetical protein
MANYITDSESGNRYGICMDFWMDAWYMNGISLVTWVTYFIL